MMIAIVMAPSYPTESVLQTGLRDSPTGG
jgi:hypothetical protein